MNKDKSLKKLRMQIEKVQDAKRFEHTLGVCYTASCLAMVFGGDVRSAQIAGLLHDCAKCIPAKKKLKICKDNKIPVTDFEREHTFLLHAKVGAWVAREKYGVTDPEILSAITWHTTGKENMTLLEKIIFVADYIEPSRKQAPNLREIRKLAFENLDTALIWILKDTLHYLDGIGGEVDPMTQKTYDYYCRQEENV